MELKYEPDWDCTVEQRYDGDICLGVSQEGNIYDNKTGECLISYVDEELAKHIVACVNYCDTHRVKVEPKLILSNNGDFIGYK